ncbi:iron complex transport system permease protein, partial [termite gut metagenome]
MRMRFAVLIILFAAAFIADILLGSVNLSWSEIGNAFTDRCENNVYREIILNYRLPKALTAILAGAALSVAGVLMQTFFHNPLAGPDVLGITSGASLGVA